MPHYMVSGNLLQWWDPSTVVHHCSSFKNRNFRLKYHPYLCKWYRFTTIWVIWTKRVGIILQFDPKKKCKYDVFLGTQNQKLPLWLIEIVKIDEKKVKIRIHDLANFHFGCILFEIFVVSVYIFGLIMRNWPIIN